MRRLLPFSHAACAAVAALAPFAFPAPDAQAQARTQARVQAPEQRWLAGDHHVHSEFSVGWTADPDHPDIPPRPIRGGDSAHTMRRNAEMARHFGLDWMVATDHGGPRHSEVTSNLAYPAVLAARRAVPGLILFHGLEFDTPGGEHSSLILPLHSDERDALRMIEAGFAERDAWPTDPMRDTKPKMLEALRFMAAMPHPPVLIANHPSRTATGFGQWGLHSPDEFRQWNDIAPNVAIGMEGAPGHQAAHPAAGRDAAHGARGLYGGHPTYGGFDQMAATLGGAWDAMLAEGRHWWITASSDSHGHWSEGGADFWPGEYTKTYVLAADDPDAILAAMRAGAIFVVTGDLISGVDIGIAQGAEPPLSVPPGGSARIDPARPVRVTIRLTLPGRPNAHGDRPIPDHVDLIRGDVRRDATRTDPVAGAVTVAHRFTAAEWTREGNMLVMQTLLPPPGGAIYLRLRGTNGHEGEPRADIPGEDPWSDLWFYTNPLWLIPLRAE